MKTPGRDGGFGGHAKWMWWIGGWLLAGSGSAVIGTAAAADTGGEIRVEVLVSGSAQAAIGTGISDSCQAVLTAQAVFRPDPVTGRYGAASEESASVTASGNGHILDVENWTYSAKQPGHGTLSFSFSPQDGKAVVGWEGYLVDYILSSPEAGQGAERLARTGIKMAEDQLITDPASGVVRFTPGAGSFLAVGNAKGQYSDPLVSAEITASYSVKRTDEEVEAVILEPANYGTWLPIAGPDATTPGTNPVVVVAELRLKGTPAPPAATRARFRFELLETTREPGLCLNFPAKDAATTDFDLQFGAAKGIPPTAENQKYETEALATSSSAVVLCYDYGGATRVKVTAITDTGKEIPAHLEGQPDKTSLALPKDDNGNRLADAWEVAQGTWGKITSASWDEADEPNDQEAPGDGISLYEKYRGFRFGRDHERLAVKKKHVFVFDPDGAGHLNLSSVMSFAEASKLEVRFVDANTWTGPGSTGAKRRIVNFNTSGYGHAVDQHALHLRTVDTQSPSLASDFQAMWKAKFGKNSTRDIRRSYGFTYYDVTGGNWADAPRTALAVELYPPMFGVLGKEFVRYHTRGLAKYADYDAATGTDLAKLDEELAKDVEAYILENGTDWKEMTDLFYMSGVSHELGHGIGIDDLVEPSTGGPWTCFMRYLNLWDFSRDPDDRMELIGRWHHPVIRPQEYCTDPTDTFEHQGCRRQIHVTDRRAGGSSLHNASTVTLAATAATDEPAEADAWFPADGPPSALQVEAELLWCGPRAGDPLRFLVRLSLPSMMEAWSGALRTNVGLRGSPPFPAFAGAWTDGLRLELTRLETNGTRTVVIPSGAWTEYRRAPVTDASPWESSSGVRKAEFLTDAARVPLPAGDYALSVAWNGRAHVALPLLPASGIVPGGERRFTVGAADTDSTRAASLRRAAFAAWDRQRFAEARQRGREALNLKPDEAGPEAIETTFVVASAALRLGDLREAAQALRTFDGSFEPANNPELRRWVQGCVEAIAPSVALGRPVAGASGLPLQVFGHPGQRYEVQASADLVTWITLDQRLVETVPYAVTDPATATHPPVRYYRVLWLP